MHCWAEQTEDDTDARPASPATAGRNQSAHTEIADSINSRAVSTPCITCRNNEALRRSGSDWKSDTFRNSFELAIG